MKTLTDEEKYCAEKYCAWLISTVGVDVSDCRAKFTFTADGSSVKAVTFHHALRMLAVTVPIPGPSIKEWREMNAAVLPRKKTKAPAINVLGIRIEKTWDWTKDRENEVRKDWRRLLHPDWEPNTRIHLHGHPASLESYADAAAGPKPWRLLDNLHDAVMQEYAENPL